MVITDHLIIYLQLLTGRVCACIRIDRTCTHRTIVVCTTYGDNPAFLSCSSSNSSMNSINSTSISTSSCSPSPRATRPAALQQLQHQPAGPPEQAPGARIQDEGYGPQQEPRRREARRRVHEAARPRGQGRGHGLRGPAAHRRDHELLLRAAHVPAHGRAEHPRPVVHARRDLRLPEPRAAHRPRVSAQQVARRRRRDRRLRGRAQGAEPAREAAHDHARGGRLRAGDEAPARAPPRARRADAPHHRRRRHDLPRGHDPGPLAHGAARVETRVRGLLVRGVRVGAAAGLLLHARAVPARAAKG